MNKSKKRQGMSKGLKSELERVPNGQRWNNMSNETNNIALDYKPKYNINIHESMLI